MVVMKEHLEGERGIFLKMLAALEGKTAEVEKQIEDFRKKFCDTCEHASGEYPCSMMMGQWPDGECWRYRKGTKEDTQEDSRLDETTAPATEKSSIKSEDQKIQDSLPCKDCANAETCDRSFFYANDDGGYNCDHKKPRKEVKV